MDDEVKFGISTLSARPGAHAAPSQLNLLGRWGTTSLVVHPDTFFNLMKNLFAL